MLWFVSKAVMTVMDILKAIETPVKRPHTIDADTQNCISQWCLLNWLNIGNERKRNGQSIAQTLRMEPVPNLRCKGGKASNIKRDWHRPQRARPVAMYCSEKLNPPFPILVNQLSGAMAVKARPWSATSPYIIKTMMTPGALTTSQVDIGGSELDRVPAPSRTKVSFR